MTRWSRFRSSSERRCRGLRSSRSAPISGRQCTTATVHGTVSYAWTIGRSVREAKAAKLDLVGAVLDATGGIILFRGNIVDVRRRTQHGWAVGEAKISGSEIFTGSTLNVHFQNENLVAVRDG